VRILANENFPGVAVSALIARGHDVVWIRLVTPGASDQDVLARAQADGRVLITFDKDFGELAFRHGLPSNCGVCFFASQRLRPSEWPTWPSSPSNQGMTGKVTFRLLRTHGYE
jgi:hypothetical protein